MGKPGAYRRDPEERAVSELRFGAIGAGGALWPDFAAGHETACGVDAMLKSVEERRWVAVGEIREAPT